MKKFCLIILILSTFCLNINAQQRGVGVRVKDASGKSKEIKIYDGSYALVIGESDYANGWDKLSGVKTDVAEVRSALERQDFKVETEINLTAEQFKTRVDRFISDYGYGANNRLLIYFAGHGHTQKSADGRDLGYIIPVDAPLPEKDDIGFRRKAVSMDAIQAFARQIESKHALFIFDSCFSGKLISRDKITIPPVIEENVAYPVRQFITAGAANQSVPDDSIFRKAFVRGIDGEADRNSDGYITGSELADYLKEKVINASDRAQTPQYGKIRDIDLDKGDIVFFSPLSKRETSASVSPIPKNTSVDTKEAESKLWDLIKESDQLEDFNLYKNKYPSGIFISQVNEKIAELNSVKVKAAEKWSGLKQIAQRLIKYDEVSAFSEGIARVKLNSKWGFIDEAGNEIINPKYDEAGTFSEDATPVKFNGKYSLIDKTGKEIILPKKYDFINSFSEGLASVVYKYKWGFIDRNGKEIIPLKYETVGAFSEGLAPVKLKGKWGAIDKTGREIISPRFEDFGEFSAGLASVTIGIKKGFIDKTGKEVISPQYDYAESFSEGLAGVKDSKTRLWGFIDTTGKMIIQPRYIGVSSFSDGMAKVSVGEFETKLGFIDKEGKIIIPHNYDKVWCYALSKQGLIGIERRGKKGFADIFGSEYFDFWQ